MFARTPRLLLRPGWIEDAPALAAAIDEGTARNTTRMPWPYGIADAEAFLSQPAGPLPSFLIIAREQGGLRLVGGVGLHGDAGEPELGYWIRADARGRGYATEAAAAVVRLAGASLRKPRLVSCHFLDNPASGRVLRKLGFTPTGQMAMRWSASRGEEVACAMFERDETVEETARPLAA